MVFKLSVVDIIMQQGYYSPYMSVSTQRIKEMKSNKINHFPGGRKMV